MAAAKRKAAPQKAAKRVSRAKASPAQQEGSEVAIVSVDDPFEFDKGLRVAKNIRVHPLDQMSARGRISEGQKRAGDRFLEIYDRSQIGGARAIDYSRVKVDISFAHAGLNEDQMAATDELRGICRHIGQRAYELLVKVIGHRAGLFDLARRSDGSIDRPHANHLSLSLKDALDDLDAFFGLARGRAPASAPYVRSIKPFAGKIDLVEMGELTTHALRAKG